MKINGYSRTKKLCESMFYCAKIKSRIEQFSIESNVHLFWFCLIALRLVKKTAPLSQPIKSETKTNPDMLTIVSCLASVTCVCLSF